MTVSAHEFSRQTGLGFIRRAAFARVSGQRPSARTMLAIERAFGWPVAGSRCRRGWSLYARNQRSSVSSGGRSSVMDARSKSLRKYGLSLLDYDELVKAQDGRCRICGTTESGVAGEVWAVDHDHVTKRVRALLCNDCNAGLGLFDDDPIRLRAAADYLETVEQRLRWWELAPAEKADYLLRHPTISDRSWTDEPRREGEKRDEFIRRVLLVDVTP
jgi:hypothetical protein